MKTYIKAFSINIVLLVCLFEVHAMDNNSSQTIYHDRNLSQFIVIGDRTGGHRPGKFTEVANYVSRQPVSDIFFVGDAIEGYSENKEAILKQWSVFDSEIKSFADKFYAVPGNHDISNDIQQDIWRQREDSLYKGIVYKNALVLLINSEDPFVTLPDEILKKQAQLEHYMQIAPERTQARILSESMKRQGKITLPSQVNLSESQIDWALGLINRYSKGRDIFVFMHKPAWEYKNEKFSKIIAALSEKNAFFIAGHEHYFHTSQHKNHFFMTMATSGGVWLKDGPGRFDHVTVWKQTSSGWNVENHIFSHNGIKVIPISINE